MSRKHISVHHEPNMHSAHPSAGYQKMEKYDQSGGGCMVSMFGLELHACAGDELGPRLY